MPREVAPTIYVGSLEDLPAAVTAITALPVGLFVTRHWSTRRFVLQLHQPLAPPARRGEVLPALYARLLRIVIPAEAVDFVGPVMQIAMPRARVIITDPRSLYRRRKCGDLRSYVLSEIRDGGLPNRRAYMQRRRVFLRAGSLQLRPSRLQLLSSDQAGFA